MDAFELLKADHNKVAQLFDLLEATSGNRKLDVLKRIKGELERHTHIEEKIFYPALEKPAETHDLTLEAYEEHKVVKTLLAELAGAKTADDQWQAKAKVLRENVEHHVEEEENELFHQADETLSDRALEALGNRMATEKARQQGRPAPKQPAEKKASSRKASSDKPGIRSRVVNLVGFSVDAAYKKTAKKSPKKKISASGVSKPGATSASKKKAGKSPSVTAGKRASAGRGAKKTVGAKRTAATKSGGTGSTKTTSAKKRASRK
jgi:hypothetical protein